MILDKFKQRMSREIESIFGITILINFILLFLFAITNFVANSPVIGHYFISQIIIHGIIVFICYFSDDVRVRRPLSQIASFAPPISIYFLFADATLAVILTSGLVLISLNILNTNYSFRFPLQLLCSFGLIFALRRLGIIPPASPVNETFMDLFIGGICFAILAVAGQILNTLKQNMTQLSERESSLKISNMRLSETEQALIEEKILLEQRVQERTHELEIASKHKDAFLATMSHELRTPLNAILSRTQAIRMGVYGEVSPIINKTVTGIESSGEHLLSVIGEILDLSKIEAGAMDLSFQEVDLSAVIADIESAIQPLATQKNLHVTIDQSDSLPPIEADPKRLRQILINLLSNAIKFTPENKNIGLNISHKTADNAITFTIWDEGIGISEENQKTLFKPFTQIDNRLSRNYEGTGLGLSIVKRLVELHNGEIGITSQPNVGSKFTVTLPLTQPNPFAEKQSTHQPIANEDAKLKEDFSHIIPA